MWTCKSCGQVMDDKLDECSNCGTGKNWSPPAQTSAGDAAPLSTTSVTTKVPPISKGATLFLRVTGVALAIIGVIAGIVILSDAPDAPHELVLQYHRDELPTQLQMTARMICLAAGWSQLIGGLTIGVLLYAVAGIGDAVRDLWKAQHND